MTRVKIGRMRHRLALEEAIATPDGGGGAIMNWVEVAEIWAAILPVSGREGVEADGLQGRATHRIIVRYRADITPHKRFRAGARIFDIKAVIDGGEARRFLSCVVEERLA